MKVSICAICKNENNYIEEWVKYHQKLGIDKIFLYDNNDLDGETLDVSLKEYIDNDFVKIVNVRGMPSAQVPSYDMFYKTEAKKYDWVIFIDIDEFIELSKKYSSIKDFLSLKIFKNYNCIRISWKQYTDSGILKIKNNNYSVERFTEFLPLGGKESHQTKAIFRSGLNITINNPHGSWDEKVKSCDSAGNTCVNAVKNPKPTWANCCLKHYRYKTIEEFITNKMSRGWATLYGNGGNDILNIDKFFSSNKKTPEKEAYAKKLLKQYKTNFINVNGFVKYNNSGFIKSNWGDDLNFFFLPKIMPYKFLPCVDKKSPNYLFIGSVYSSAYVGKGSIVWGSGMIRSNANFSNIEKPSKVYAVRGPLTRAKLLENGIECPEIYGDPALLLPKFYFPQIEKKYDVGVILHHNSIDIPTKLGSSSGVKIIQMNKYTNFTDIIDVILSCRLIVSESLHGLIVAEAYGIPNVWANFELKGKEHGSFKFHDFFLSIKRDRENPFKLTDETTKEELIETGKRYERGIMVDLQKLINACPLKIQNLSIKQTKIGYIDEDLKKSKKTIRKANFHPLA